MGDCQFQQVTNMEDHPVTWLAPQKPVCEQREVKGRRGASTLLNSVLLTLGPQV